MNYLLDNLGPAGTGLALMAVVLSVVISLAYVSTRAQNQALDHDTKAIEPADLTAKITAVKDAGVRQRAETRLREAAAHKPITQAVFDGAVQGAKNELARTAQLDVLRS